MIARGKKFDQNDPHQLLEISAQECGVGKAVINDIPDREHYLFVSLETSATTQANVKYFPHHKNSK